MRRFAPEGISVSPRRWKKTLTITKARAWLEGDEAVEVEHLTCLTSVLWRDPEERRTVERLVYQAACPIYLTALETEDAMSDLVKNLPEKTSAHYEGAVENCLMQLSDGYHMLNDQVLKSRAKHLDRAKQSLATIEAMHNSMARGIMQRMQRLSLHP
jgi:hypothetical protein